MDRARKRQIAFIIIIVLLIIFATIYFLWGTVINRGKIVVNGDAPFQVQLFQENYTECEVSPCEIKTTRGEKNLIISKLNHKTVTQQSTVKLFRTTTIDVVFTQIPTITTTATIPQLPEPTVYELTFDETANQEKLIRAGSPISSSIVNFSKPLTNARIFGSEDFVLIISESGDDVYKIDVKNNSKDSLITQNLSTLEEGVWSNDGQYFVFERTDSAFLWVLDSNGNATQTDLLLELDQLGWIYDNSLVFVTNQGYISQGITGKYGQDYIELTENIAGAYTFAAYHPDEDSYTRYESFTEISTLPTTLIPTSNGKTIYFEIEDNRYYIAL